MPGVSTPGTDLLHVGGGEVLNVGQRSRLRLDGFGWLGGRCRALPGALGGHGTAATSPAQVELAAEVPGRR